MTRPRISLGDIALIPASNCYVPAKVLYLSKRYKKVILLGIYKMAIATKRMPSTLPEDFAHLVYTSQEMISEGDWFLVGNEPLRSTQHGLAKRIVAGDVWLDDEYLGAASERDLQVLPKMAVLGAGLVDDLAEAISQGVKAT